MLSFEPVKNVNIKDEECCLNSAKYLGHSSLNQDFLDQSVIIKNFNHFNELNFNCTNVTLKTYVLFFIPNYKILLDNTLRFTYLLYSIQFQQSKFIIIFNLEGYNFASYKTIYKYLNEYTVSMHFSAFQFYINQRLVDENFCKLSTFNNTKIDFFGTIKVLMMDTNNYYSKNTCPYVFINTKLIRLTLNQISNSLILKNQLEFIEINQTNDFDLNNQDFYYLNVAFTYEKLSMKFLNKYVFRYIKRLVVWGIIYDVETDLFKDFKYLQFFSVNFENMKQLLDNNNKWMKHINHHAKVNVNGRKFK
jgi:hypothetical protein